MSVSDKFTVKIQHPDWMDEGRIAKAYQLYRQKKLPSSIEGWMLLTPIKHELRAIYGSDLRAAWELSAQAVQEYIRIRWVYHVERRLYYVPWFLAVCWNGIWGGFRYWILGNISCAYMWGRHESPEPVICECGWRGPRRWAIHGYQDDGNGDSEPVDQCPRCEDEL